MLIDEARITVEAGHGGPGKATFFPSRNKKGGPSGGNGGKGGNIYAVLNLHMSDLNKYSLKNSYKAENGQSGEGFLRKGADGQDLELPLPEGTTITEEVTGKVYEITRDNTRILLAKGGPGGKGNNALKSSIHTTPRQAELGKPGEEKILRLVMRLIADVGLIGLPNAGKSSLLNLLTAAHAKIGSYTFTTLEPNLGAYNGQILADIPGLIEGAAQGKGLGTKFLKHVEKVELLLHCIAADSQDVVKDYEVVRGELGLFNPALLEKKRGHCADEKRLS